MATRLGDMTVGSTVKIKVNGTAKDFIIVHQGNPDSTIYDSSCYGTWVLMKNIYENLVWSSPRIGDYARSDINSYLNSTFLNRIDADIREEIKQVKIPCRNGNTPAKIPAQCDRNEHQILLYGEQRRCRAGLFRGQLEQWLGS